MGFLIFILGVFAGWFAEWLFFTFIVKSDSATSESLKAELDAKNSEIRSLKTKLDNASTGSKTDATKDKAVDAKAEAVTVTSGSTSSTSKTSSAKTKIEPAKKSTKKPTNKATASKSSTTKKTPAKKTTTKAKTATKKTAPKKTVTKKSTAKKKPVATKKTTVKNPATTKKVAKNPGADDLTKLSGIGPSMAGTLKELGIDSYRKLAATNDDILRDMLEASGARLNNNKEAMDSWNEQATLADKGDFAGLKKLQDALKN